MFMIVQINLYEMKLVKLLTAICFTFLVLSEVSIKTIQSDMSVLGNMVLNGKR